jgi:cytochrome subunit of sulfide dehydrogenase
MKTRAILLAAGVAAALPWTCNAQGQEALYVRSLAATCANCHGTNGNAVQGSAVVGLAGMPRDTMLQQLKAFRDGTRPATVMHQIVKGFSEPQLQQIAGYFAAQPK